MKRFTFILTINLIVLKLLDVIEWDWYIVLLTPFVVSTILIIIHFVLIFVMIFMVYCCLFLRYKDEPKIFEYKFKRFIDKLKK